MYMRISVWFGIAMGSRVPTDGQRRYDQAISALVCKESVLIGWWGRLGFMQMRALADRVSPECNSLYKVFPASRESSCGVDIIEAGVRLDHNETVAVQNQWLRQCQSGYFDSL